jgi:hypothetical protein
MHAIATAMKMERRRGTLCRSRKSLRGYKRAESNAANANGTNTSLPTNRTAITREIPSRTKVVLAYHGSWDSVIAASGLELL